MLLAPHPASARGSSEFNSIGTAAAENEPPKLSGDQIAEHAGAAWFAVAASGELFGSDDAQLFDVGQEADGYVTPYLIDNLVAWTACFVEHDEDYPLASYTYWGSSSSKTIQLQCGYHNSTSGSGHGWHHISVQHESQWRDRIIQLSTGDPTGAGWDDLMSFVNDTTIAWPMVDKSHGSKKRCVGAPVLMYDKYGNYEYTFYPSVIFTTNTKRVITSIPSSSYTC
ncbi:MAG: hypothetical protein QM602_09705 [Microbacterium sp.]